MLCVIMPQCVTCSEALASREFHRCYGCLGSVCEKCAYPFRFLAYHNPAVFCSPKCCGVYMGKRKEEADAEYYAEDIGTDDSEWSEETSETGSDTEDFIASSSSEDE